MFTGLITDVGCVRTIERRAGDDAWRIAIDTRYDIADVAVGASVACGGPCLTVVEKGPGWLSFDVSGETLSRTTIGGWTEGTRVNLERALKLGDELGGHLVTGHIDGLGEITARRPEGDSLRLSTRAPQDLARFIAPKGAIAIDGVSLTVNEVDDAVFGVNIIPHTQSETTLGTLSIGDRVNLEIDLIARYVARLQAAGC